MPWDVLPASSAPAAVPPAAVRNVLLLTRRRPTRPPSHKNPARPPVPPGDPSGTGRVTAGYCWSGVPTPPVHGLPYSGAYRWETRNLLTNCCSRGSAGELSRSWNPHEETTIGDGSPG